MYFNPYGGRAAQLAVDLVNAPDGAGRQELVNALTAHDYRPTSGVTEADAVAVYVWAQRLRPVFAEPERDARVRLVNELLAETAARPYVSQHDGRPPHLHYADERASLVGRVTAYTAAGVAHALCADADRIGACGRNGCDVVFVDTSRNGRRRFCSPRCATRVHVAAHRQRARVEV